MAVAASDKHHGCGVDCSTCNRTNANADTRALDWRRAARVASNWCSVSDRRRALRVGIGSATASVVRCCTWEHRQARVDHAHQRVHRLVWVRVEWRSWLVQLQLHLVDLVRRNVCLCKCSNEIHRRGSVVWHQGVHLDLVDGNAETICNALWQVGKDLADGHAVASNERIVECVGEPDLDQCSIWCC